MTQTCQQLDLIAVVDLPGEIDGESWGWCFADEVAVDAVRRTT
jgi:hypothetical protein